MDEDYNVVEVFALGRGVKNGSFYTWVGNLKAKMEPTSLCNRATRSVEMNRIYV